MDKQTKKPAALQSFGREDDVLDRRPFTDDEVRYNLMHLNRDNPEALRLKAGDEKLIFTWSQGRNGWLWIDASLDRAERETRVRGLLDELDRRSVRLSGATGQEDDMRFLMKEYAARQGLEARENMGLEAYDCTDVRAPSGVEGAARAVRPDDAETVAEFLAGFVRDAFGMERTADSFADDAAGMAASGNLFFWEVGGQPAAMANLAHASRRHRRMNEVYTPPACRKRGYAGALVSALCLRMLEEGITPMLFADTANPDSNGVYRRVGFVSKGRLLDVRFHEPNAR
ncbi:GNAT family N-acetyltransferase [Saccharibacillus sp. CPCC 101409]|uniref:GNAT family N-acetyltransferase n=1 Tax=Saccharibacillus sp. CPCC 101409 TaxID=3058041 RepID=UPI00267168DE|nr:GNAT family N-acetyltransferase [Saccharibacillus sp. CPCC 101409]MDO3410027.1 GNAT family N-acetyltransferase [Saccharibacillus sp. CPCC 101409]